MKTILIKMTDAYEYQSFYKKINDLEIIDLRDIEGTRCYCDDLARNVIKSRLSAMVTSGIHFIDSGNYHYLSLFFLEKIDTDFDLILFDHHPDNQPPSFGDILSCGGWVLAALESLPHLKSVYTFGVGDEVPAKLINSPRPLFISIDKDVLNSDFATTDWDQGTMTLDEMCKSLSELFSSNQVIGVDICGDSGEFAQSAAPLNSQTNSILFDFLSALL